MNKAFTPLELVVVIIILGVLATLGLTQYGRMVEKGRNAEARQILGQMRALALSYYLENRTFQGITAAKLGLGSAEDQIPDSCRASHYFQYQVLTDSSWATLAATRCGSGGKTPQGSPSCILCLDLYWGRDDWRVCNGTCSW